MTGTHPVPEKYRLVHRELASWGRIERYPELLATEAVRRAYD